MVAIRWEAAVAALAVAVGLVSAVPSHACTHQLSDTTIVLCEPDTDDWPNDSTGRLVTLIPVQGFATGGVQPRARISSRVGALLEHHAGRISGLWFATRLSGSGVHTLSLLARGPASGEIEPDAIPVVALKRDGVPGIDLLAPSTTAGDSVHVVVRSGSRVVRSRTMACGLLAHVGAWPSAFAVRGTGAGVEYTWRLAGVRSVRLGSSSVVGDRVSVTVRMPRGNIMPVLVQGAGMDMLRLAPERIPPSLPSPRPAPPLTKS